ncbi:MAG: C40 family peptidase [Bacteroidaceae bacterium]|nr:C40 family peptidase [Bacteroidaceae bacterium]
MNGNIKKWLILLLCCLPWSNGARIMGQGQTIADHLNDSLKQVFAPDGRTAIWKITCTTLGRQVTLEGTTTSRQGRQELVHALQRQDLLVTDSIRLLPEDNGLGEETWGIVKNSVCNLRSGADYAEENVTQGLMGMPVRIIQRDKWLQVQLPDEYLGWVEPVAIQRVSKQELEAWNAAPKVVVTALYGMVFAEPDEQSHMVSDVVAGNRLKLLGKHGKFFHVGYADGREGYLPKDMGQELEQWRAGLDNSVEGILKTAWRLHGIPYLWAGTSAKGVDCSGFVRTTLYMHDIIIPRDASQQCLKGQRIETTDDYKYLQAGDLLFFGRRNPETGRERVSHVGFYLGGKRFIHSIGRVHENSLDPNDPLYDESNTRRLLFAGRVIPYINKESGLNTTDQNPFYQTSLNF